MNVARGFKEVRHTFFQNNIPTALHNEFGELRNELGRSSKSLTMEALEDVILKYKGEVEFDGFTSIDEMSRYVRKCA